jgi:hypothetical protein
VGVFLSQTRLGLILAIRNRMALIYGFVFPLIFLIVFWTLYRHDEVPIALHLGELLTVTILGGACFGLPTTLVSEREAGVWRRYRLTPTPAWLFIASALTTRFILIFVAALMQIALALILGMPAPAHPLGLLAAFALTALAFMGLGLIIAAVADNVATVQALGQCIFLPMLIIGGVAVRLSTLPEWALHVSAFFPGRYAVAALQSSATGGGLASVGFDLMALALIGAAALIAALALFRWDAGKRVRARWDRGWLALALGVWVLVGGLAEWQGRVAAADIVLENVGNASDYIRIAPAPSNPTPLLESPSTPTPAPVAPTLNAGPLPLPKPAQLPAPPQDWRAVTREDFKRVAYDRLPPDSGVVAPVGASTEDPDPLVYDRLERIANGLQGWPPGRVSDPVQRVRNYLYPAAIADLQQMGDIERFVPLIVFERMQQDISAYELTRALYWVAMHPDDGEDTAVDQVQALGLPVTAVGQRQALRGRVMLYAFKLLGRLTGDIPAS